MTRILSALLLCTFIAISAAGEVITLSVTNSRPIWKALQQLSRTYGYALTYEDPVLSYQQDLEDVTDQVSRQVVVPGQKRIMSPKNGTVSVGYELGADGKPRDILEVVGKVLHADAERIGPRFTFFQDGEFIHVVPTRTKDENGQWVLVESVLDARITIPENERSVEFFLEAVCQALSKMIGVPVKLGTIPLNAFILSKTSQGANDEVARDVIVRALSTFESRKPTWSLNYDPGLKYYVFNVGFAVSPVSTIPRSLPVLPPNRNDSLTPMGVRTQ